MPFDTRALQDFTADPINDAILGRLASTRKAANAATPLVILNPLAGQARRNRELIRWRVPLYGVVDMYINPQSLSIDEKKIISKQRTKGGYVIQYWGEELAVVNIEGHTGSAGIEGINILRQVYRAEQDAFQSVSQILIDKLNAFTGSNTIEDSGARAAARSTGQPNNEAPPTILGNGANPPLLPTLGSLATSVEMYYQGWVFRGYFDSFRVTESVANGVGVFNYTMTFTVLDRRGYRSNFMPWHRQPAISIFGRPLPNTYNYSDSAATPMTFGGNET